MVIKKRVNSTNDKSIIEDLANELSDKPYGENKKNISVVRTTISLPSSILFYLEDLAKNNKRNKSELRSVSAIIRHCIDKTYDIIFD